MHHSSVVHQEPRVFEISIACKDLIALDQGSPSDPCCYVRISDDGKTAKAIGRTEEIMDNADAEFLEKFVMPVVLGRRLVLTLYDIDSSSANTEEHDLIGTAMIKLAKIVEASEIGRTFYEQKLFFKGKHEGRGSIKLFAEEYKGCKSVYKIQFVAFKFPDKYARHIRKRKVFYEIRKYVDSTLGSTNANKLLVHRSEVVEVNHEHKSVDWKPFTVNSFTFCSNEEEKKLEITVWKHDRIKGAHKNIGRFETSVQQLSLPAGVEFMSEKCHFKLASFASHPAEEFIEETIKYEDAKKTYIPSGGVSFHEKFSEHTGHGENASKVISAIGAITTGTALATVDGFNNLRQMSDE